jgi:hypothetical protein
MKKLHLSLNSIWFEMTMAGIKTMPSWNDRAYQKVKFHEMQAHASDLMLGTDE